MVDEARIAATREMMAGGRPWPHLLLPLRHATRHHPDWPTLPLLGYLMEPCPQGPVEVRLGCIFGEVAETRTPTETFASIEDCVSAGWLCD